MNKRFLAAIKRPLIAMGIIKVKVKPTITVPKTKPAGTGAVLFDAGDRAEPLEFIRSPYSYNNLAASALAADVRAAERGPAAKSKLDAPATHAAKAAPKRKPRAKKATASPVARQHKARKPRRKPTA